MSKLDFFRSKKVGELLDRAHRAGAMSLSIHYLDGGDEGPSIAGAGKCEACRYVAEIAGGKKACRDCRVGPSEKALRRGKAIPFVCHLGFSCVAVPAASSMEGFVLTAGPFVPLEAPQGLEEDVIGGLENLDENLEDGLPFALEDVKAVGGDTAPAIVQWTALSLDELWTRWRRDNEMQADEGVKEEEDHRSGRRRKRKVAPERDPYQGADIAAALAGGNRDQSRRLVDSVLFETVSGKEVRLAVKRARTVAVVSATLEAAERAGLDTYGAWERFGALAEAVKAGRTERALRTAAMDVLGTLKKKTRKVLPKDDGLITLNRLVLKGLADGVTLKEVAVALDQHPTAITHRLQRRYGMSFTQYVGRLRVDKAKEALRRTRLGVGEVARRVGLNDTSNFSKLFRKFEGISPLEYRRRYGSK